MDTRKKLQLIGLGLFCTILIISGLQIIFGGILAHITSQASQMSFQGIERLIGIVPILIGWFLLKEIIKDWRNNL